MRLPFLKTLFLVVSYIIDAKLLTLLILIVVILLVTTRFIFNIAAFALVFAFIFVVDKAVARFDWSPPSKLDVFVKKLNIGDKAVNVSLPLDIVLIFV